MKVAICDDEQLYVDSLKQGVKQCSAGQMVTIDTFLSGNLLLDRIVEGNTYQIYFLDIELEDGNGMEIAKKIRERDRTAVIIFVTNYKEYMQSAFDVQAFQFIVKPFDKVQTHKIIHNAIRYVNEVNACFTYKKQKQFITVRNEEILYFESQKRKICIYTQNGVNAFYGTMEQIRKTANPLFFVQIHKSFIVNIIAVVGFHGGEVALTDGTRLTVSRNYTKTFNEAYRNFLLSRIS